MLPSTAVRFTARVALLTVVMLYAAVVSVQAQQERVIVEDFQDVPVGEVPENWGYAERDGSLTSMEEKMGEDVRFYVVEEDGEKMLRGESHGRSLRMSLPANGEHGGIRWDLEAYPRLRWSWRAHELPEGAREDRSGLNDTGAALYVTFETNWLGIPRSIKYTYSSTLPVGTVVEFTGLRVIVVSSGADDHGDRWLTIERDVVQDYKNVFGRTAPEVPIGISVWTDSTETDTSSEVDFGTIELRPAPQRPSGGAW
ncbi:MAG: DUF3047 domain-containing protein [Bacteroidetes bacterium]|jgi:hypothetical protein|nr:DUF3047 domain-containing protein [Bacteroidota bacterium]